MSPWDLQLPSWCHGSSGGLWGSGGPDTAPAVPKVHQSLQETVRSFKVTNEELAARADRGNQDVATCDAACRVRDGAGRHCLVSPGSQISAPCWGSGWPLLLLARAGPGPTAGHAGDRCAGPCPAPQLLSRCHCFRLGGRGRVLPEASKAVPGVGTLQ